MSKIVLPQSPVVFEENPHGYWLDGKRLSGITGLIHAILDLGVYPGANEFAKQVAIPRAGHYGTSVHNSIETYDKYGIKVTAFPEVSFKTKDYGTIICGPFDVSQELETYIKHREGFEPIANEYTVSDSKQYASNIDNVWRKIETQGIWLIDTKTNNLDYYPGGVDGLKQYLSWQLSIYAVLFEKITGLKVEGLACNWLRKEAGEFWEIKRQPDAFVLALLENTKAEWRDYTMPPPHGWQYKWTASDELLNTLKSNKANLPVPQSKQEIIGAKVIEQITDFLRKEREIKTAMEEFKSKLKAAMICNGIKSFECETFKATIGADSYPMTLDTKKFKEEHSDLYNKYAKVGFRAGSFTIKLKDNERK